MSLKFSSSGAKYYVHTLAFGIPPVSRGAGPQMDELNRVINKEVTEMKKVFWALGLTMVFNIAGVAQSQKKSADNAAGLSAVTSLQAELQSAVDVRNAKVGDQVVLKTTQAIRQNSEVIIPKGTSLIGRVTEVQQRAKNGTASRLGLVFDRLQGRDISTPITASITSITNLHATNSMSDMAGTDISGSGSTSTRASSSGGLLGGVTNTVGGVMNTTTQTVGGATDTATRTVGGTTQTVGQSLNGIQISSSASGSAQSSTTLSSPNGNIRLEKGVTFNLRVQKSRGN